MSKRLVSIRHAAKRAARKRRAKTLSLEGLVRLVEAHPDMLVTTEGATRILHRLRSPRVRVIVWPNRTITRSDVPLHLAVRMTVHDAAKVLGIEMD